MSVYGLCHLGDYEATVFSKYSHNRRFGESLITGETCEGLAEGYYTVKAILELGERFSVELPICAAVYRIIYEQRNPEEEMALLFEREQKREF